MTNALPKWLANRYSVLWREFKGDPFSFERAQEVLNEKDPKTLSVVLSDLRKHGWLSVELDPNNSRKRLYKLKSPELAVEEIGIEYPKTKPLDEFIYGDRKQ